jgi:predicted RNA binding protein YcfA (HicA-like mRNA interferase family)
VGKVYTSDEMLKLVRKDGWVLDHIEGSHHIFYHKDKLGMVVIPVHTKTLAKGTANSILKQAGLK